MSNIELRVFPQRPPMDEDVVANLGHAKRFNQFQDVDHCLISSATSRVFRCVGLGKTFDKYILFLPFATVAADN
jgi:hypothetical protein